MSLEAFAASLSEDDRRHLHGSIAFALRVVASADSEVDKRELAIAEHWRASARERLGEAFAAPEGAYPEAMAAAADFEWPQSAYVRRVRAVIATMPADAKSTYQRFVVELALAVASASGGFLGMGQKVSGEERYSIRRLIAGFGIEVEDADERARLGF